MHYWVLFALFFCSAVVIHKQTVCLEQETVFTFLPFWAGTQFSSPGIYVREHQILGISDKARSCTRSSILRSVLKWGKDNRTGSWLDSTVISLFPYLSSFSCSSSRKEPTLCQEAIRMPTLQPTIGPQQSWESFQLDRSFFCLVCNKINERSWST